MNNFKILIKNYFKTQNLQRFVFPAESIYHQSFLKSLDTHKFK